MQKKWILNDKTTESMVLASETGITPFLAHLLWYRGIQDEASVKTYLGAGRKNLSLPNSLLNMAAAVEKIEQAIAQEVPITIYGDYDVDGFCASTLLKRALNLFTQKVDIYIPNRLDEGYGLNREALSYLEEKGTKLVITVDCGVSSADLVAEYQAKGLDFIITDHHQIPEQLPECIVVNPQLEAHMEVPYRYLCGCGVAFMLALALGEKFKVEPAVQEKLWGLVDIVAIATVADIVPLQGDNRILVKEGLKKMQTETRPFIQAILDTAGILPAYLDCQGIGFQIAPRINACGRMNEIDLGLKCLLSETYDEAKPYALKMEEVNKSRKALVEETWQEALALIQESQQEADATLVVYGPFHQGIIGIVASRLVDKFHKPTVVLAENGEEYVGSARSIEGIHLFQTFQQLDALLVKYGGHAKAAGLTLEASQKEAFKEAFEKACALQLRDKKLEPELHIDAIIEPHHIHERLYQELQSVEPTGLGNAKTIFAFSNLQDYSLRAVGQEGRHLQIVLDHGLRGIAFNFGDCLKWMKDKPAIDLAISIKKTSFRNLERLEFNVEDIRPSFLSSEDDMMDKLLWEGERYVQDDPYLDIETKKNFFTKVVGTSFFDRQNIISNLLHGDALYLEREPENPFDKNAILVKSPRGIVGYLKRKLVRHLAPQIDFEKKDYEIIQWDRTGGEDDNFLGINIEIKTKGENADLEEASPRYHTYSDDAIREALLNGGVYHPLQSQSIQALREKKRILAMMPTGRGKTLIGQVRAAELAREGKMTIAFFPLRALANDQFMRWQDMAEKLGLSICKATGAMNYDERESFFVGYLNGDYDVILTTPEFYLAHEETFLKQSEKIGLWLIDEAHYLSSRRLGYQKLPQALAQKPDAEVLALTATADALTYETIQKVLKIETTIVDDFVRDNLQIVDHRGDKNRLNYLISLATKGEQTLVYVNSRRQAFELARQLRLEMDFSLRGRIGYYHGGLPQKYRREIEQAFADKKINLLMTTTAFGEGVDLPDIRHVVFYHLPFSEESFNQLAGRAGRDGQKSYVHLLYGERDKSLNLNILSLDTPTRTMLGKVYLYLRGKGNFGEPIAYTPEAIFEDLRKTEEAFFDVKQVKKSLDIFAQLNLLKLTQKEYQNIVILLQQTGKSNLELSMSYREGEIERKTFENFCGLAFQNDLHLLTEKINQVLIPKRKE